MEYEGLQFVYIKLRKKYNGSEKSVVLSGKYNVKEKGKNHIKIIKEEEYIDKLWGEKISDCYAIVGENGSGKTQIMNMIMDFFYYQKNTGIKSDLEFYVLFEDIKTKQLFKYSLGTTAELIIENNTGKDICVLTKNRINNLQNECKLAYFHNVLTKNDYEIRQLCDYDFSIGGLISHYLRMGVEMNYYDIGKDGVRIYFSEQQFQIINFIYKFRNNKHIPFPLPKYISISFDDDSYNWKYILKYLENIKTQGQVGITIKKILDEFFSKFETSWINETIKKLIINCFKEIAIPKIVPAGEEYTENRTKFFQLFNDIKDMDFEEYDIFDIVLNFFMHLKSDIKYNIDKYINFVEWLKMNKKEIKSKFIKNARKEIIVSVDDSTYKFISELIDLYSKTCFEFPFLTFNFNMSSGEYYFLSIFSQLYSIIDNGEKKALEYTSVDDNVKSILVMMDEPDISLHPRWQKNFIYWITEFINSNFQNVRVQVIIATHSPLLLSDFPHTNVLYLSKKINKSGEDDYVAEKNNNKKTFGSNIHTLFLDSFFLENYGTMGRFAQERISELADYLINGNTNDNEYKYNKKNMIACVGENILHNKLEELYKRNVPEYSKDIRNDRKDLSVIETLGLLKKQRKEIDKLIYELEKRYDKN